MDENTRRVDDEDTKRLSTDGETDVKFEVAKCETEMTEPTKSMAIEESDESSEASIEEAKRQKLRRYAYVSGGSLLLAILTVILSVMGGVFDFSPDPIESLPITAPQVTVAPAPTITFRPTEVPVSEAPKDTSPPATSQVGQIYTLSIIADKGGTVTPSGSLPMTHGERLTVLIEPEDGYLIDEVIVDGESEGAIDSYTFNYINKAHSLSVTFKLAPVPSPTIPLSPTDIYG